MDRDENEIAYYRAIEDFFAASRGVPHILSSKDVQLMVGWWREDIPLEAITSAIAEVFTRRRLANEADPTVSLSYCRHAVQAQARRYAELRVGEENDELNQVDSSGLEAVAQLSAELERISEQHRSKFPAAAEVIASIATQLQSPNAMPRAMRDDFLFNLESALLEGCWRCLPEETQLEIQQTVQEKAAQSGAIGEALERFIRAMNDRELRLLLDLPRLQLDV